MVKVLRVITRLNIGGPAIHAILLSSALNKSGTYKDVLVCGKTSEREGDMMCLAERSGLRPVVITAMEREISLWKDIKAFVAIFKIIKKEKPDIVHTHMAKAGAIGRLAAILGGAPIRVHTFHGHIFDGYFSPFRTKVFTLIERILALFTDRVIMVSETVRNDIVRRLKVAEEAKSVVIPLGLDLEKFLKCEERKGELRKTLGAAPDDLLVGIVGRLVPIKNHRMFLDTARIILNRMPGGSVKFLIIGDGEQRPFLEQYTKDMKLEQNVIFTGWVRDLAYVYADLDVVALTSLNEGTPVSLIEAMASAKPVVATSAGGVKDIIREGENGLLVHTNSAEDFSGRLLTLLENAQARLTLGNHGREFVSRRYTQHRLVNDIERLYEECMEKKRAG